MWVVDILGGDKVLTALREMGPEMKAAERQGLEAGAIIVETAAKARLKGGGSGSAGVVLPDRLTSRTGVSGLRGQITRRVSDDSAEVGTNLVYGPIHEFGGVIANGWGRGIRIEMPRRPFLRPALDDNVNEVREVFVDSIYRAIGP